MVSPLGPIRPPRASLNVWLIEGLSWHLVTVEMSCVACQCPPHPAVLLSALIASGAVDGLNTSVIVYSGHKHRCNVLYNTTINTGLGLWRH